MLGRHNEALSYARDAVEATELLDMVAIALLVRAGVANRRGDAAGAARLLGASEAVREATGYEFEPGEQNLLATMTAEMGDALEDPSARVAYEEGRALDPDGARALAGSRA
jgi:hypothetical protein